MDEPTRTYKVIGPHVVAGHLPGVSFNSTPLLHEQALIDGGHLELVSSELLVCPACADQGKERKARSYETLAKHYRKDHPGLVPPTAGEEE